MTAFTRGSTPRLHAVPQDGGRHVHKRTLYTMCRTRSENAQVDRGSCGWLSGHLWQRGASQAGTLFERFVKHPTFRPTPLSFPLIVNFFHASMLSPLSQGLLVAPGVLDDYLDNVRPSARHPQESAPLNQHHTLSGTNKPDEPLCSDSIRNLLEVPPVALVSTLSSFVVPVTSPR